MDFKTHTLSKPIKRYYRVSKWLKGRSIDWVATNNYGSVYPSAGTVSQSRSTGYTNGYVVARAHVTYYV